MAALFVASNSNEQSDSDDNQILLQLCINKHYELTANIDPKQDIWKLAQLNANDINMNDLKDEIKNAFRSRKPFQPLFTAIDRYECQIYSYETTKATLRIEEDDDLQTEVDVFIGSDNESEEGDITKQKYLKLRIVFYLRDIEIKNDITEKQTPKSTKSTNIKTETKESNLICFCGNRFIFVNAKQAYHGQFESCNMCNTVCKYHLYYCSQEFHETDFCLCHKCGSKLINEAAKNNKDQNGIPEQFKDPITDKIMKNPTMVVSSAQIYDEITIEKLLELKLGYDIINGIPFSNGAWPVLFERRIDIKDRIDVFLRQHPEFTSQVIDKNDENDFLYKLLLKKQRYHTELEKKVFQTIQDHSNLNHTPKQIFKPIQQKEEQKLSEFAEEHLRLRLKAKQIYDKVEIKNRGWLFKKHENCFLGSEAVQVIMDLKMANDEDTAIAFGNKLMEHDIIWHVTNEHDFKNEKQKYYIFVEDFSVFDVQETDTAGIEYDNTIRLDPNIPVVCIMGPSRNGKSTIVNDILGVKNACEVSFSSNVALTKGAW
eukprot:119930_1